MKIVVLYSLLFPSSRWHLRKACGGQYPQICRNRCTKTTGTCGTLWGNLGKCGKIHGNIYGTTNMEMHILAVLAQNRDLWKKYEENFVEYCGGCVERVLDEL